MGRGGGAIVPGQETNQTSEISLKPLLQAQLDCTYEINPINPCLLHKVYYDLCNSIKADRIRCFISSEDYKAARLPAPDYVTNRFTSKLQSKIAVQMSAKRNKTFPYDLQT